MQLRKKLPNWCLKREDGSRGAWVVCKYDLQDEYATYCGYDYESTKTEALRRNASEPVQLCEKDVVFGFDCDDDGKTVFWLGTDYEDGYEGWLLCDNVPFKVRAEDFTVVKKKEGDDILKPNDKPLSVRNYQCFDDDNLPDNVEIMDSEDESNEEDMDDFVQSEQEDEHIETDYVPSLDCTGMHCEILLKTATPQLYRENAFRTLGLPVNVTLRDIERHQQKLKMAAKLGINSHDQKHSYLPLASPPNEDSIQHAMERLRDPEKQLIDEFFWFWPTKAGSYNGEAFELLLNCLQKTVSMKL